VAELIHPDGTVTEHRPGNPPDWTLAELQFLVGGFLEQARPPGWLPRGETVLAFCDEDGLSKGLAANATASRLLGRQYVGPVLIIADEERVA